MKNETTDVYEMLDTLSLPVAAQRFAELSESPEFGSYTALQFLREVLVIIPDLRPTQATV